MKQTLLFVLLLFAGTSSLAQQAAVYGQYFHNPFLYNPAYAGADPYPIATLTHQRFLSGIDEAPIASTLTFQTPLFEKIGFGSMVHTESQGLLSYSAAQLALVYVLPLKEGADLRFGLGVGISKNQLDLSSATESQLAYLGDISRSFLQADIRFGLVFHSKRLSLGFSLPNMTRKNLISYDHFRTTKIDPFEHLVLNGSIKLDLNSNQLQLEPVMIYERFNSTLEQRIEGGLLLHIKDIVWIGGTYQLNRSLSGLFGIKIKDYVSFGYAYGMNSKFSGIFNYASHELQLKVKLGKEKVVEKEPRKHMPRFQSTDF